jgi:fumarylpyruvate hydrolase
MTQYVIEALEQVSVPVVGTTARFPVQRIYCVGRNYVDHAQEMGFTGREPPFFFIKPANTVVVANAGETATVPYPTLTKDFQHEIELVACIGTGGKNIKAADAKKYIYGYAVGLDMTRRDLQGEQKKLGRPWCIGKSFDHASPIGPITPVDQAGDIENAELFIQVDGKDRQRSTVSKLIWNIGEIIEHISNG